MPPRPDRRWVSCTGFGRFVRVIVLWEGRRVASCRCTRSRSTGDSTGVDPDDHDELSIVGSDGRWSWHILARSQLDDATYAEVVAAAIDTRTRWRHEYEAAKERAGPPSFGNSATDTTKEVA